MKRCPACGQLKSLDDFNKNVRTKDGRQWYCKDCQRVANRGYQAVHREQARARGRAWERAHAAERNEKTKRWQHAHHDQRNAWQRAYGKRTRPIRAEKDRRVHLRKSYNLTVQQFSEMLAAQGGKCAICGCDKPNGRRPQFCVDHDHGTGKVRGILCARCNWLLGYARDSIAILKNAIDYLDQARTFAEGEQAAMEDGLKRAEVAAA